MLLQTSNCTQKNLVLFTFHRLARRLKKSSLQKSKKSTHPGPIFCKKSMIVDTSSDSQYNTRPPLPSYPPIWAQSRQEVCESLEWFRSYQGGVYFSNNIVKGYLLSAFPSQRDFFHHNGKLIISHGGGKSESLSSAGGKLEIRSAEDQQARDLSVRALLNNHAQQIPLVLLIDDRYPRFPYDLSKRGIAYAVLGLYIITHVWQEYEEKTSTERGRVVRFKFSFQWCEDQGEPWWWWKEPEVRTSEPETPEPRALFSRSIPVKRKETKFSELNSADRLAESPSCSTCRRPSPQVFSIGWACLCSDCPSFWTLSTGIELPGSLEYHEPFLQLKRTISLDDEFRDIRPPEPLANPSNKVTTVHAFSRGWHCKKCGRLSSRFKFERWECGNCGNSLPVRGKIWTAKELRGVDIKVPFVLIGYKLLEGSGIKKTFDKPFVNDTSGGFCQTFCLPDRKGHIHHIRTSPLKLGEADEIFELYQQEASESKLPFRRFPLTTHKLRGALLTNYFSHNCGEPYQYVGGTNNTVSWEEAPQAVTKARDYITSRIKIALDLDSEFNEVLSAAYMERQKMSFHTDDERGLGPRVAGLSLGSPALMHFRSVEKQSPRPIVLSIILRHGDVLVMDGAGVQASYEHTVVPANFRIAATARWITPRK
ncbi:hypothetical protein K435DRAFT_834976 [Dendrothele bispora CBS 962.96]|uniref:Fe2OG dioxygenase domain-containing protein n=1 Tax=Dendrothele bispora (strain CBS 962.96) TaxID=1314807 RepID=A0A4S8MRM1_DENBC|nr:hypothetical protein K435DRAFT_834976 [Dendrothele bispora CBS 962.96]